MAEEQYSSLATIKTGCEGVPKQTKIRIERWIDKLTAPAASSNASSRKNRDAYLSLLAMDVERGDLREPFDRLPPNGPLRTLPPHLPLRHALQLPRRRAPAAAAAQQRSTSAAARQPPPSAPTTPHKTGDQRWSDGGSGGGGGVLHAAAAAAGGGGVRSSAGDVSAFPPRPPPPRFAGVRARSMSPLRRVEVEVACSTSSADEQRASDDERGAAPPTFGALPPRLQQWQQQQQQQQEAGDMQAAAAAAYGVRFGAAAAGAERAHAMSRLGTHEYLEYVEWFTGAARKLATAALRA
ncbi:hypothetical protein JKP88DRAFT_283292 [Tribonema minus]|uniref:DUF4485 domain-containing protein n=1 Tax=Tribonema minus TaxID=303371 RepID=A0A835YI52_9STRA|nr:hypothetical protein JKP88DRAFT_283292 [Tribonema minus]